MKTRYTVLASMCGQMADNMRENGRIITCMAGVFTPGRTEENTRVNTRTTENMDMVFILGPTTDSMLETGRMESNTEKESIDLQTEQKRAAFGKKAKELGGSKSDK